MKPVNTYKTNAKNSIQCWMNSNATCIASIDDSYTLTISNLGSDPHTPVTDKVADRKDVWSFVWASDDPYSFALMEKQKLIVYQNNTLEDQFVASGRTLFIKI